MILKGKTKEQIEQERLERLTKEIRRNRNRLLEKTDKYMLEDYPISKDLKEQMKVFRQSLRDLTKQEGFPLKIEWPIPPIKDLYIERDT